MNHALLAKWNRHVACGDVLLLTSRGAEAVGIKAYQSTRRGERAKYTHVAVVISPDEVVDAMPPEGVGFRRWSDMEAQYDLEHCSVARNIGLASNPEAFRLLYERATYYYKQPYKLQQLFSPPQKLVDQVGLVCSQFVALLLSDVGTNASARPVFETLPIDIDQATRTSACWRQFSLLEYGMCSKCHPSEGGAEYRNDYLQAFPIELSPEQQQAAQTMAKRIADDDGALDGFISSSDELLARFQVQDREFNDLLRSMRDEQYEASRLAQELDDLMAGYNRRLARQQVSEEELSELVASMRAWMPVEVRGFSGASELSTWRWVFVDYKKHTSIFLHAERRTANHVEFCRFFRKQLEQIEGTAAAYATLFDKFATSFGELTELVQRGLHTDEIIQSWCVTSEQLQRDIELFCGESQEDVQKRIDGYAHLFGELNEWLRLNDVEPRIAEDAKKCLLAIQHLDFERLACLERQRALASVVNATKTHACKDQSI